MNTLSRRSFLKSSAAGVLGVAATTLLGGLNVMASQEGTAVYTPGTYTATAVGMGEVTVTMTFSETAITDVEVDTSNETLDLAVNSAKDFRQALLDAQGAEIDGVSGATVTTTAVKEAALDCIAQAMGVDVSELAPETEAAVEEAVAGAIVWPTCEPEYTPVAAGEGTIAYEADPIDESAVAAEIDVDVLVCGLGPAGFAAALSSAQHGLNTAVIEKNAGPSIQSMTIGGLHVNEYSQVLNTSNQPIEGLYALGNTSGSMFYGTYPHSMNCLSHTRCIVFGYNVGKNLAEN